MTTTSATLSTLDADASPYGSLVSFALARNGDPLLLVSEMAEHTRNLRRSARCSLLVAEDAGGDGVSPNPLARARVTIVGTAEVFRDGEEDAQFRAMFVEQNPTAARYAAFGDFHVWRIRAAKVRFIGGFGKMSFVDVFEWEGAREDVVSTNAGKRAFLTKWNASECGEELCAIAKRFSRAQKVKKASLRSVDRYGVEFDADTEVGMRPIRVPFERRAEEFEDAEGLFLALVTSAKAKGPGA